jgi:hypothetical protein
MVSEDGGQTAKVAITGRGVAAEYIVGVLGEFAQIRANQIMIGDVGQTIPDDLINGAGRWNKRTVLIDDTGIYAGRITTDQLVAGNAKIAAALIENLIVGSNVQMGPNAYIGWGNVTGVPSNVYNPSYIQSTKITETTIESPTISAGSINGTNITGVNITGSTITGTTIKTSAVGTRVELSSGYADINLYNGNLNIMRVQDQVNGNVRIWSPSGGTIAIGGGTGSVSPSGLWDFSSATVSNLNVVAKFA